MSNLVILGPSYFPSVSTGTPVGAGSVYIGDVDTDPSRSVHQKTVSALTEGGDLIEMSQPITLSAGGIPLYLGSPVSLYVDGNYSVLVLDINDAQVYYIPSTPGSILGSEVTGDLAVSGNLTVGDWPVNNNIPQFDGEDPAGLEDSGESVSSIGVLDTPAEWSGAQNFNTLALTSTTNAVAWNLNLAQCAVHIMTENTTISAPTNMKDGMTGRIRIVQAAGVYTLAWNAAFEWGAQSASAEPAADGDLIIIAYDTDGTTMFVSEFMRVEA